MNRKPRQSAFTLIELMVTLAVAVIVLTVGVPGLQSFFVNSRLTTQTNQLVSALNLARCEAIKRGVWVTVCKSANPTASSPSCAASGGWEQGWVVFVDSSNIGTIDAGEPVLRVFNKLDVTTLSGGGNFSKWISYLPSGISQGDTKLPNGTFTLCQAKAKKGKNILINATGRLRTEDTSC